MSREEIDAVVLWVDGSDPAWLREKNRYAGKDEKTVDASAVRYRDWGLLKHWFRSLEQNAPWIRRVFFVTNGQFPDWLNPNAPKLRFVKHADYMPAEYLPTFSANPIELNLHRIPDLSEQFVFFNDDMYLMNPVVPEDFFREGLPVYPAALHSIVPLSGKSEEIMTHIYVNDIALINRNFRIEALRNNGANWFSPGKAGLKHAIMSFLSARHSGYIGFYNHHLPVPLRKSTMREVWKKEEGTLHAASLNRFRSMSDVNQYIFRYWELAGQTFVPIRPEKLGTYCVIGTDAQRLANLLERYSGKMICLNDSDVDEMCSEAEFETLKKTLQNSFERRFPQKSSFEK